MSVSLEQELKSKNAHSPKITKEDMISWLKDPRGRSYSDWLKTTQEPLKLLEKISASLKQLIEAEFDLKEYYLRTLTPFIVRALNLAAEALENQVNARNGMLAYTLTQSILLSSEKLLKNNPPKTLKSYKTDLGFLIAGLQAQLPPDAAKSALPINTTAFFSLVQHLHQYRLLQLHDIPKLMFDSSKLFKTVKFSPAKIHKQIENLVEDPEMTSPQASDWLKALANFAEGQLLKLPLNHQLVTSLMSVLLMPGRQKIDPACAKTLLNLQKMGAIDLHKWDFSPFNHYLCAAPEQPLRASTKTLLNTLIIASNFCREMNHHKVGGVKKIDMIGIERAWDNFLDNQDYTAIEAAQWLISTGHIMQVDHPEGSSAKLKDKTAELLRALNNPATAKNLSLAQIAHIFYGSLLIGVTDKELTHHLYSAFREKLKMELAKKSMTKEQIDKFVNQVAQYTSACGQEASKEMKDSIKKRKPEIDEHSFQHKLIAHVRTLNWFKNSQEVEEEKLNHNLWATDGYVKLKGRPQRYIVEVDSRLVHDVRKFQDGRRDQFILNQPPEEVGTEMLGIIRIPVDKNTSINAAAAVWKKKYEELIKNWELNQHSRQLSENGPPLEEQKKQTIREERQESSRTREFYDRQKTSLKTEPKAAVTIAKTPVVSGSGKQKQRNDSALPLTDETTKLEKKPAAKRVDIQDENQNPNVPSTKTKSNELDYAFSVLDNHESVNRLEQEKAFNILAKASTAKSPAVLNALGQCYEEGIGITPDHKYAFRCYQSAVDQQSEEGYYHLGRCYEEGIGVKKDPQMSMRFYGIAAESISDAQNKMGEFYQQGVHIRKDIAIAYELFQEAASANNLPAQYNLAKLYLTGAEPEVMQNQTMAATILQEIAADYPPAYVELGRCFEEGWGVEKNPSTAFVCFQQAVTECQSPVAQYELGRCYLQGIGHKHDMVNSLDNLSKAAQRGYSVAQIKLGQILDDFLNKKRGLELVVRFGDPGRVEKAKHSLQHLQGYDQKTTLSGIIDRRKESPMLSQVTRGKPAAKQEDPIIQRKKMSDLRTMR